MFAKVGVKGKQSNYSCLHGVELEYFQAPYA
jgi:hypothetical protein